MFVHLVDEQRGVVVVAVVFVVFDALMLAGL